MVRSKVTTAAPAYLTPPQTKLLPSVYSTSSGDASGVSVRSGWTVCTMLMTSRQSWRGSFGSSSGRRLAGLTASVLWNLMWGWSSRRAWNWVIRAFDIQRSGALLSRASTAWGAVRISSWPRVSLSASLMRTAVAATAWRQVGHPDATGLSL